MRAAMVLVLLGALAGCGESYGRNDLELITAFTAKQLCSCLFVIGREERACRAWVRESPAVATASIDLEAKVVEAEAMMLWSARARYTGERFGCVLEPAP